LTPAEFESACVSGAFCVHWSAHGLHYGIPVQSLHDVVAGTDCLANFSRSALAQAARVFAQMTVINVTARPETLAKRLAARGRETEAEIAKRLGHANKPLPQGLNVIHLSNDGPIEHTVTAAVHALQPVRG
jgi:ribose 1,5-bisphosphokinase